MFRKIVLYVWIQISSDLDVDVVIDVNCFNAHVVLDIVLFTDKN